MSADMLKSMAPKPIVFACSNPDPEIKPELAHATRDDLIIATGRSDYPNQVNNVLGFPFIFRGALDVRARRINEAMKIAAVHAIRELAKKPVPADVLKAYDLSSLSFGREYIIPKPMDTRLLSTRRRRRGESRGRFRRGALALPEALPSVRTTLIRCQIRTRRKKGRRFFRSAGLFCFSLRLNQARSYPSASSAFRANRHLQDSIRPYRAHRAGARATRDHRDSIRPDGADC